MRASTSTHPACGSALVIALLVLSLAAVVALAGARGTAFGLRIAGASLARLELRTAADNALERALAAALPTGAGVETFRERADMGRESVDTFVETRRDRRLPFGTVPADGFSLGLGGAAFGAEHYTARARVSNARGAVVTVEQQFYLLVPEGP